MLKQSLPRSKAQPKREPKPVNAKKKPTVQRIPKVYLRPDVSLLMKSKAQMSKEKLKHINEKYVNKYYGNKVLYVKNETQEKRLKHYLKDIRTLSISQNRSTSWGALGDSDTEYGDADYEEENQKVLRYSYRINYEDTLYSGRRIILGNDIKIITKRNLKLIQRMISSSTHKKLKFDKLKSIELLHYVMNVNILELEIKDPSLKTFSKVSLRPDSFKSLKSLNFELLLNCASKTGGWKIHEKVSINRFLESLSKSKLLTSAFFHFRFVRFANNNMLKSIGLWLDHNRDRNFHVHVELEAINYALSVIPIISFKPILKHCDLLKIFVRNDRKLSFRDYQDSDDEEDIAADAVPWLAPGDIARPFEKKRKIVLSIFKDDDSPFRSDREDIRAILACCENLKSLIFFTSVSLFTWGANEEYRAEGRPNFFLKKDRQITDKYDSQKVVNYEEEEEEVDEEELRLKKIEAENKAKKCLQELEEIVIACVTIMGDDNQEVNMVEKFITFCKQKDMFILNNSVLEDVNYLEEAGLKPLNSLDLPEFLKYLVTKINESSCSLNYLSLCHSFFDKELASKGAKYYEDRITTYMLADEDWQFGSVKTLEIYPGKKDDYGKLKSMLVRMKNLNELIVNLKPFYRDQKITIEEAEGHLKDIREALPKLSIKIIDKIW